MKIRTKLKANYSKEELEKAELLEAYTKLLSGEKLSRKQRKLLNRQRYDYEEELAPLKQIVDFAHQQSEVMIESVVPSPSVSRRVETNLMNLISGDSTSDFAGNLQPAYDMELVGSDSELAQMEYEYNVVEPISQRQESRNYLLRFEIVEGDEVGREYIVTIPQIIPDRGENATMREITIGRGLDAQIRLPDSSGKLSRIHAKLESYKDGVCITDLNSSNGTYVDGKRITGSHKLSSDSIVKLGDVGIKILSIES
jgi:hypothetical protein